MASNVLGLLLMAVTGGQGDLMVLHFTAQWCGPCQQMQPALQRLRGEGWDIRAVDADQMPQYVQAYRVQNLPTLVLLSGGQEVDRIVGLASYEQMQQRLQRAAARTGGAPQSAAAAGVAPATSSTSTPGGASGPPPASAQPAAMVRGQSPGVAAVPRSIVHAAAARRGSPQPQAPSAQGTLPLDQAIARAARATVRIRVEEANTVAHGTGTIIDTHEGEALVLTCGHLFRDMDPASQISVDLFAGTAQQVRLPAQLIDFVADDADVGLISFRLPVHVEPVPLLPRTEVLQVGQPAFSFGCDHGRDPSRRDTRIKHINRFLGAANVEIAGAPVVGRSGGGLFDNQGRLIGVCNAADADSDEGIYAAAEVIYAQLQRLNLNHLFDAPAAPVQLASQSGPVGSGSTPSADLATATSAPAAQGTPPTAGGLAWPDQSPEVAALAATQLAGTTPSTLAGTTASATQIICILRGADGSDRVVRIDAPDADLLQRIEQQVR
ncbi:MAG: hypothetical protein D6753_08860 [Planctomycetota bacterium]|nr:MAG: hypothetical protein D6753_08860 [Planctomycetota bacterium]